MSVSKQALSMLIQKHKETGFVQGRRSEQVKKLGTVLTVHVYTVHVKLKCLFTEHHVGWTQVQQYYTVSKLHVQSVNMFMLKAKHVYALPEMDLCFTYETRKFFSHLHIKHVNQMLHVQVFHDLYCMQKSSLMIHYPL